VTVATTVVVIAGLIVAVVVGAGRGLDAAALVVLAAMIGVGGLAVVAARRASRGVVSPERCPVCGGLNSTSAGNCSHCGARLPR
jgi:hypothetical protein